MDLSKLTKILKDQPAYRYKQIQQAIFRYAVLSWDEVKTLPRELREKLAKYCPLDIKAKIFHSSDGQTSKALITRCGW